MSNIKLGNTDYSRIDEIEKVINTINGAVLEYNRSTKNKAHDLKNINNQIDKKIKNIDEANKVTLDLTKKLEELEEVKVLSKKRIKELEEEKNSISFSSDDIQRMELDEINSLINSKNMKLNKITGLIDESKKEITSNNKNLSNLKNELEKLEANKVTAEQSLKRTDALINLLNDYSEKYINDVKYILSKDFIENKEPAVKEEPVKEIKKEKEEKKEVKPVKENIENKEPKDNKEEEKKEISVEEKLEKIAKEEKPLVNEKKEEPKEKTDDKEKSELDKEDFSVLDLWEEDLKKMQDEPKETEPDKPIKEDKKEEPVKEEIEPPIIGDKKEDNYDEIKELFNKENISFDDFDEDTKVVLNEHIKEVKANLEVLKKHKIPLNLTIDQSKIYYNIKKEDLDDLLSIITTDEDGNGMGFDIKFTYYCLDELSNINVDKLIDVYNQEFMNITNKSGIISLLKKTNPNLGTFEATINANKKILKDYGVNTVDEIENACIDFVEIDNPLFLDILNVFDKDDLVQKLNSDAKIADQILEYWKNN